MIPLYIGGSFAVLHPASGRRCALICGPLADEALNSYRSLVLLGEHLSSVEVPALRLAWFGTGDSAGEDEQPGRFQQWLDGIHAGIAWLRKECGAEAVTLIGHRVGASLAARAACDSDLVDSLVLINPISGRQFLHELTLAARISQRIWQTSHKVDDGIWFEAHGLRIDHATRDALNALDVRKLPARPAARALVLEAESRPATLAQIEALRRLGTEATFQAHAGLDRMQRDSYEAGIPGSAIDGIAQWMHLLPDPGKAKRAPDPAIAASLEAGLARETAVHFGPDAALFGILSEPERLSPVGPAILIVNTSANPRWGNSRIAVDLARILATDGLASLRMDASGMGDSAPASGEVGQPYSQAVTEDALHAAAELERRTGRPVAILGFCSGAYHALQAACHDPAIRGLVLVNLPRFIWREGDPPDTERNSDLRPTRFYVRNILSAQAWSRLVRGDFDAVNLVRVLMLRVLRRAVASIEPLVGGLLGSATRVGRVRLAVQDLARRGVPILYALGRNDPGVEELAAYFGRDGWRLRLQPNITMQVLEDADHTLGASSVRATLIRHIRDWCHDNWRATHSGTERTDGGWTAEPVRVRAGAMHAVHRTPLAVLFRRTSVPGR